MRRRSGYTLLEVILAVAIGLLIVAALYVAMDVQFRYMQAGRDAVAEGQLARGVLSRIASDIRLSLASLPRSSASETTDVAASADVGGETSTSGATTGAQIDGSEQVGTSSQFNFGVVGDQAQMTLFISALPRYGRIEDEIQTGMSDLRQVSYWLVPGEGLARHEVRSVAASSSPGGDAPPVLLAPEVTALGFRYFDPSLGDWATTWDGTTSGPPLAVEIRLGIQPPRGLPGLTTYQRPVKLYRLVVAVPAASIPQELVNSQTGTVAQPGQ